MKNHEIAKHSGSPQQHDRRKVVKKLITGVGVLAGYSMLPQQWSKPLVGFASLPAHAATSGVNVNKNFTLTLVKGDQKSDTLTLEIKGSVSPDTADLVTIITNDEDNKELLITSTDEDGEFTGEILIQGGPGIKSVTIKAIVEGADGEASGDLDIPEKFDGDDYNSEKTFSLNNLSGNNKKYTWLDRTGSSFGGKIKFDFGDCGILEVPDSEKSHGADGNTSNHDQAFYFCGTDFPKGSPENNNNLASIFTPPHCNASKVTVYFNK